MSSDARTVGSSEMAVDEKVQFNPIRLVGRSVVVEWVVCTDSV